MIEPLSRVLCRLLDLVESAIEDEHKTRRLAALFLIVVIALITLNVTDPGPSDSESLMHQVMAWVARTTTQALESN